MVSLELPDLDPDMRHRAETGSLKDCGKSQQPFRSLMEKKT
jgi:hypothetical protein